MYKVSGLLVCAIFFISIFTGSAKESSVKWETDLVNAQKIAASQQKDIFVYFTGSDWCTYCIMLHKEVFDKGTFLEDMSKKYVFLKIDFPQRKPLPEVTQQKNDKLAEDYEVQGFPTVLLMDKEGKAFGKTGYKGLGPDKYAEHINELASKKQIRDKNFAEARSKEGIQKAEALIKALSALGDVPTLQYKSVQEEIFKADPEDKTGFKKNIVIKQKIAGMEEYLVKLIESGKQKEALSEIDKFLNEQKPEGENKQKVMIFKVYIYEKDSINLDEVNKLMDTIIAIDPKTETAENARGIKEQVLEMRKAEKK